MLTFMSKYLKINKYYIHVNFHVKIFNNNKLQLFDVLHEFEQIIIYFKILKNVTN